MLPLISALIGAAIGSFVQATVHRVHAGVGWVVARSRCPACLVPLKWFELVPVASFLIQGGRCRQCSARLTPEYFAVELASAVLFVVPVFVHAGSPQFTALIARDWCALALLLFIFLYDLHFELILDRVTVPAIALFGVWNTLLGQRIAPLVLGVAFGGGFFLLQRLVSRGRWVGGGDVRLGALMGALLGWQGLIVGLYVAYLSGALVALALIALRKKRFGESVPFGAFLAPAALVALWWGSDIIRWYQALLRV